MKIFTLFLLLLCIPLYLSAQGEYYVIATSGLKLRATPSQQGKVLAVAPFGSKVTVKNKWTSSADGHNSYYVPHARRDTIGFLPSSSKYASLQRPHTGYWLTVVYEGKTGYMFSGFLWGAAKDESIPKNLNETWRVQFPGGNAAGSAFPDVERKFNWYGIFQQENGKYALRAVHLQYAVADYKDENGQSEILDTEVITAAADVSEQPIFLIGHTGRLTERADISGDYAYSNSRKSKFQLQYGMPKADLLRQYDIAVKKNSPDNDWDYSVFLTNASGRKQEILLPMEQDNRGVFNLTWVGDLDGDGRYDYFCNMGDKFGANMLYLSTQAKRGEIAGLVAVDWHWYIC